MLADIHKMAIAVHDLLRCHYVPRLIQKDGLAILAVGPGGTKIKTLNVA
jgi:hypothetical protein